MIRTTVSVRVDMPGFHYWPGAPKHRAYLRSPHYHVFSVVATMPVSHGDRDVELHDMRKVVGIALARLFPNGDLGPQSCEHVAARLLGELPGLSEVTVSEDEFHWATARREGGSR